MCGPHRSRPPRMPMPRRCETNGFLYLVRMLLAGPFQALVEEFIVTACDQHRATFRVDREGREYADAAAELSVHRINAHLGCVRVRGCAVEELARECKLIVSVGTPLRAGRVGREAP